MLLLGVQMFQGFLGEGDHVHGLGLRGLHLALHHAKALNVLCLRLRGREDEVLQFRRLREQREVGGLVCARVLGTLRRDDAESLARAGHEVDVMYGVGDKKLNFLLSGCRELVGLQLENIPDLLSITTAGNATSVCRRFLFAVDSQVHLQVVQASEL